VVAARGERVLLVGECRWRGAPMGRDVLDDLYAFKLPALAQTGTDVSAASVALFSKVGFRAGLVTEAHARGNVRLVDVERLVAELQPLPR